MASLVTSADLPESGGHSDPTREQVQIRADAAARAMADRLARGRRSTGTSQCGLCRAWFPNAGVHCTNGPTTVIEGELTAGCHRSFFDQEAHLRHIVDGSCVRDLTSVGLTEVDGVWEVTKGKTK